jgi:alpha-glucosidase (family GH31 glycosyl hydrolase)
VRSVLLLALVCCSSCAPAFAAGPTVTSGRLSATVGSDPWHLALADRGSPLLSESRATGPSITGALGFANAAGIWFHATRVLSEKESAGGIQADVATTDPLGGTIHVTIAPDADGVIALTASGPATASRTGISFDATRDERFLGFGERSNAVDQRGNSVESYVAEGPYQPAERAPLAAFVPPWGYHPRDDASYFPIPWLLSTRGHGALIDGYDRSELHAASDTPDAWTAVVDGPELRLRFFAGPTPAAALRRFSASVGRQPPAAAPFYFGPWFQPSGDEAQNIEALRRAGAPASVAQTYTHYLPCGAQQGKTDEQRRRTAAFHAAGLAVTTYFNPMICTGYQPAFDQAAAGGYLTKNALGQPYEYRYTGSEQFLVGQFDFSNPAAADFYRRLLGEAVADGYDGWMEDFGEYTPTDSVSYDGTPGPRMHNRYPVLYHGAASDFARSAPRPLARFNRSGWTGAARASQIVWGGDPSTSWGFDGLASALRNGLTMGLSGVSIWGSDIGGYFSLASPQLTPELLARWIELGAVSGVMRTQANGFATPEKPRRPQIFDPDVLPVWKRYARLRTRLYPYIAAAEREYDRSGLPIMRHLALVYPGDRRAAARDDEFMFGPDLLAAPVLAPAARSRKLYLPRGRWVDFWRGPGTLAGGREVRVPAALGELPLLVRAGAVLPLLPADVDTLTGYGRAPGLVHLGDRRGRLSLLAYPRGNSRAVIGHGEGVRSAESRGGWTLRVRGRHARRYSLQAALGTLRRPFRPCAVTVAGRRRPFEYTRRSRVLRVSFSARRAAVVRVRRSCR